jgi:hypothetical protein
MVAASPERRSRLFPPSSFVTSLSHAQGDSYSWGLGLISVGKEEEKEAYSLDMQLVQTDLWEEEGSPSLSPLYLYPLLKR